MTGTEAAVDRNPTLPGDVGAATSPVLVSCSGDELPMLSKAIEAAKGSDPICYDMDKVWELADLLEPLDPTLTGWHVDIAEAAMILFGDVELGPADHAVRWLWYAQNTTTCLLGPWDQRTLTANRVLGRRCRDLGLYDEAVAAWQPVVVWQGHHGYPDAADEARIEQAVCMYGLGRCREAVALLERAWADRLRTGRAGRRVGAALPLVYIEMLRLCWRRDEAQAAWQAVAEHIPESILARQEMIHGYGRVLDARTHGPSCTARPLSRPRHVGNRALLPRSTALAGTEDRIEMPELSVVCRPSDAVVGLDSDASYLASLSSASQVPAGTEIDARRVAAPP